MVSSKLCSIQNKKLKWCLILVGSIVLFGVLAYLLLHVVLLISGNESLDSPKDFGFDDFQNVLSGEELGSQQWISGQNEDPYLSHNSTRLWANAVASVNDGLLSLQILNALDDDWQSLFDTVISDWNQSSVLDLTIQRVNVDHSCSRVQGVMKICNANFGDTGYLGFNEVETNGDVIVSSIAQMNEYYLYNSDTSRKQYTLCHELGHGFGLPHTDENPYNADLGNCMDYTLTPENNLHPGPANFQRLVSMYPRDGNGDHIDSNYYDGGDEGQSVPYQYNEVANDKDVVASEADWRKRNDPQKRRNLRRVVTRHYLSI